MAVAWHGALLASPAEKPLYPIRPQKPLPSNPPAPTPPALPDTLGQRGLYVEANELIQDDANHRVTAQGEVEARYQGKVIRADQLTYDTATGVLEVKGNVVIVNADGTVEYSSYSIVDQGQSRGVSKNFATRLTGDVVVAGATAVRKSATLNEMNEVIYTPCKICARHPAPTWDIRARTAVEDKKRQLVYFRNAVLEVFGVPVFYTPVLWQADPAVDRKSGFLTPSVNITGRRGFTWDQPYLQILSRSADVIIDPQINTKVNPFLNVDLRKRFYSGSIDVRAGYTYDQDFDSSGRKFGSETSRSYVLSKGLFAIDNNWSWGFTVERANDPLIFDKYSVPTPFEDRGLYAADDRRLTSQVYAIRQSDTSYLSIAAVDIQGLRATDVNSTIPTIAPLIEAHYEPDQPIFGGRLRLAGSGVVLTRDDSPYNPEQPGIDSRRGTAQADWQRSFFLPDGIRIDPFLNARADVYNLSKLSAPYNSSATITRGMATAGFDVSWPFFKRMGKVTYILEPLAQVAISPKTQQDPRIPNEDSLVFEFDDTNLFQTDKSPGFDLYEGGQRLNIGGRATIESDSGREMSVLFGRSFRAHPDPNLPARTGLSSTASDWVIGADGSPVPHLWFFTHIRLAPDTFAFNRLEVGANYTTPRFTGQVRYLKENEDSTGLPVDAIDFNGQVYATKNWGVTFGGTRDFELGAWTQRNAGVVYKNECLTLEVFYERTETYNRTLGPSSGIGIRLTLATFGNSGYSPSSFGHSE
jgi:LPS-assembly protein